MQLSLKSLTEQFSLIIRCREYLVYSEALSITTELLITWDMLFKVFSCFNLNCVAISFQSKKTEKYRFELIYVNGIFTQK